MPHLMTGPEHLAEAARLAHEAVNASVYDELAQRYGLAAQAHASIAQTLVFAALVAGDATEPELAEPWMAVVDPTGEVRAAMRAAAEKREAERAERMAAADAAGPSPYGSAYATPSPYGAPSPSAYA